MRRELLGGARFEGRDFLLRQIKSCQPEHKFVTTLKWTFTFGAGWDRDQEQVVAAPDLLLTSN